VCGIAGIWNLDGEPVDRGELTAMTGALAHRGPDGEGFHLDGAVGLGHRRLAIIDPGPGGFQPMSFADGRYWITYNGEIYNFLELRRELEGFGFRFRTESDTEVLLAAFHKWGPDCLLKFNGMWAFAIWDSLERSLFLARDRFGVKPLFYLWTGKKLAFASEMKAFLGLSWYEASFDASMVASAIYDIGLVEGDSACLLKGLRNLQAGHFLVITEGREPRVDRWWKTVDHLVEVPAAFGDQVEAFRELFLDAVRIRMRSDVPVASSVSGGLDSSSVLCAMAETRRQRGSREREAENWRMAFFSWYPGTVNDERTFAETAIRRAGARPVILEMQPDTISDSFDDFVYQVEAVQSPHPGPWLLYREMRNRGVFVSLEGHGGDELVAGYVHHVRAAMARALRGFPRLSTALEMATILRCMAAGGDRRISIADWKSVLGTILKKGRSRGGRPETWPPPTAEQRPSNALMNQENASWWLKVTPRSDLLHVIPPGETAGMAPLDALLYRDYHVRALRTILRDFDRYSMSFGIETRCPFVDWRLVCFAFSLPFESKLGDGWNKRILREAMGGILPESIRLRLFKSGYKAPLNEWWRGGLRRIVFETVSSHGFLESDLWDGPALLRMIESIPEGEFFAGARVLLRFVVAHRLMELFRSRRAMIQGGRY